jgi:hypothetical protein
VQNHDLALIAFSPARPAFGRVRSLACWAVTDWFLVVFFCVYKLKLVVQGFDSMRRKEMWKMGARKDNNFIQPYKGYLIECGHWCCFCDRASKAHLSWVGRGVKDNISGAL